MSPDDPGVDDPPDELLDSLDELDDELVDDSDEDPDDDESDDDEPFPSLPDEPFFEDADAEERESFR